VRHLLLPLLLLLSERVSLNIAWMLNSTDSIINIENSSVLGGIALWELTPSFISCLSEAPFISSLDKWVIKHDNTLLDL
jgi:hypothetical protein